MGMLLKIVGGLWAVIGLGNIILMPWAKHTDAFNAAGIMLNVVLFVLPGLVVLGLGTMVPKKGEKA